MLSPSNLFLYHSDPLWRISLFPTEYIDAHVTTSPNPRGPPGAYLAQHPLLDQIRPLARSQTLSDQENKKILPEYGFFAKLLFLEAVPPC